MEGGAFGEPAKLEASQGLAGAPVLGAQARHRAPGAGLELGGQSREVQVVDLGFEDGERRGDAGQEFETACPLGQVLWLEQADLGEQGAQRGRRMGQRVAREFRGCVERSGRLVGVGDGARGESGHPWALGAPDVEPAQAHVGLEVR